MTMAEFWTWVLYVALAGYFGLSVVVVIGGWFDIRKMLRRLSEQQECQGNEQAAGEGREDHGR